MTFHFESMHRADTLHQFQKILVINLPSRTDHKDAFILSSALTGIKGTFVDGVDGKKVSDKALPPNYGEYVMGDGNRGSWRAHLNAIQQFVSQEFPLRCENARADRNSGLSQKTSRVHSS